MLIIKIQNDSTGTVEVGNYRYQVMVNETVIESGEIKNHERSNGWRELLQMLIDKPEHNLRDAMIRFICENGWS